MEKMTDSQRREIVALVESMAWGDLDGDLQTMEDTLRRACAITVEAFQLWEDEGERRYVNEFSVTASQFEAMTEGWRLAVVARLAEDIALVYGVQAALCAGETEIAHVRTGTLSALLHGLRDIVFSATESEESCHA